MDINTYKNFVEIVESGSITAAALKIRMGQSSLSSQMKTLQDELGVKLLVAQRGIRKIELTEAGLIFYNKVKYLCQLDSKIKEEMKDMAAGFGTLNICLSPSESISFINEFLSEFSKQNPKIHFNLYEIDAVEQTRQLLGGVAEIGVIGTPLLQPEIFDVLYTVREKMGIVFPKKNPWFKENEEIDIAKLKDVPLSLSRVCANILINTCKKDAININVLSINTTKTSAVTWARRGNGAAIIPMSFSTTFDDDLCCKPIKDDRLFVDKSLVIVKGRELSPVVHKFLSYCKQCRALRSEG